MLVPVRIISSALALALAGTSGIALSAGNSSLDNLTVSESFPAWQTTQKYELKTGGGAQFFSNYARVTAQVRYDAATKSYIVRDTGNVNKTSTFAPANKVAAESNSTFTVYRKTSGSTTETLRLLNPGVGNPLIQLTYASYGAWRQSTPGAGWNGATAVSDTYFVYGIKTPSANVPRTGTATYNAVLDGSFVNKDRVYALSGTGSFLANFSTAKINYSATPVGTPTSGAPINFGTVSGSGNIAFASSSFTGNPDSLNPTYKMGLSGYFYGPAATEIGATFRLTGGGGTGTGVMIGKTP